MVELIALGAFIGFLSGLFGISGGAALVPLLIQFGYTIKEAIGLSVMQMLFSSIFGSYINYKNGKLKLNDGIYLGMGGFLGATQSGFIVVFMPQIALMVFFSLALLFAILKFYFAPHEPHGQENNSKLTLFFIGFFIGMGAISIGIGGGMFLAPILVGFMHYDLKKAISMGLFFIIFSSSAGFISMAYNDLINYEDGLYLGIGAVIGVYFGAKYSLSMDKTILKRLLLERYIILLILTLAQLL